MNGRMGAILGRCPFRDGCMWFWDVLGRSGALLYPYPPLTFSKRNHHMFQSYHNYHIISTVWGSCRTICHARTCPILSISNHLFNNRSRLGCSSPNMSTSTMVNQLVNPPLLFLPPLPGTRKRFQNIRGSSLGRSGAATGCASAAFARPTPRRDPMGRKRRKSAARGGAIRSLKI